MYNQRKQQAQQDHGGQRKVELKIFFFNSYISRQSSNPVELVMKEVNNYTNHNYSNADKNQIFSRL